jgi:hypothetical protein
VIEQLSCDDANFKIVSKFVPDGNVVPKAPESGGMGFNNIINCDDEEDCIAGSGSGDGPTSNQFPATGSEAAGADGRIEVWYPEGSDSKLECFYHFVVFVNLTFLTYFAHYFYFIVFYTIPYHEQSNFVSFKVYLHTCLILKYLSSQSANTAC